MRRWLPLVMGTVILLSGCQQIGNFVSNTATGGDGGVYIFMRGSQVTYVGSGSLADRIARGQALGRGTSAKVILRVNPNLTNNPAGVEDAAEQIAIDYYTAKGEPLQNVGTALAQTNRYYTQNMQDAETYIRDWGWKPGTAEDPLDWNSPDVTDLALPDLAVIPDIPADPAA